MGKPRLARPNPVAWTAAAVALTSAAVLSAAGPAQAAPRPDATRAGVISTVAGGLGGPGTGTAIGLDGNVYGVTYAAGQHPARPGRPGHRRRG
jgi:hypothetical protein